MELEPDSQIALAGCTISRPRSLGGEVEIVSADAVPRLFPTHVSQTLGICLKIGRAHAVTAEGKLLSYPADRLSVRAPGCVWSCEAAPVGFLSIDIGTSFLPEDLATRTMRFLAPEGLELASVARVLTRGGALAAQEALARLVLYVLDAGGLGGGRSTKVDPRATRIVKRACDLLSAELCADLDLDGLAAVAGINKFSLIRQFRRVLGTTPFGYRNLVRVEAARDLLARGAPAVEVAVRVGFADQAHLSRMFKRVLGLSPGEYARTVRLVR